MQRRLLGPGYLIVANPRHPLIKIRLDFNSTATYLSTCSFKLRVASKHSLFRITSYTLHDCPPSTHANFKQRNSAWYLASLVEREITINRKIKPKEIRERARIYHKLQRVPYMPAWRARERFLDTLNGDEGASFNLIPT